MSEVREERGLGCMECEALAVAGQWVMPPGPLSELPSHLVSWFGPAKSPRKS